MRQRRDLRHLQRSRPLQVYRTQSHVQLRRLDASIVTKPAPSMKATMVRRLLVLRPLPLQICRIQSHVQLLRSDASVVTTQTPSKRANMADLKKAEKREERKKKEKAKKKNNSVR